MQKGELHIESIFAMFRALLQNAMGHHAPEVSQEDIATVDATQWWEEEEEEEETEAMDGVVS